MTPERWRRITEAFHAVLARGPASRQLVLSEASRGDVALQRDVERLLQAHHDAADFGETPVSLPVSSLQPGTRIGPYVVETLLGAGGMGEVYRAHDPKLRRAVAIKILSPHIPSDIERLAGFEREARVLASLNHPNIGAIYAIEEVEGGSALIMELIDGEDLCDRMARAPLTAQEVLPIALQIAEAIEAAHEQGIVHRDLKPVNIRLRQDGTVKVVDFGLATALGPKSSESARPAHPANETDRDLGEAIFGTAAYMSPEQAQGRGADKRSDVWAFGVIVCEMLTGRPLYGGVTPADTLASVIEGEPLVSSLPLPATTPSAIATLLQRCLTKNPRERLQAIGEARIVLGRVIAGAHGAPLPQTERAVAASEGPPYVRWQRGSPWVVAVALATAVVFWSTRPMTEPLESLRLTTDVGGGASLATATGDALAISPDGRIVAFVARNGADEKTQLYLRRLGALSEADATALPGTAGAESPFFAPDSKQVAFFAGGKLKRIAVSGGAPVTVCDASTVSGGPGAGGAWADDGTIVFVPGGGPGVIIWRVSAAGGKAEPLASLARGEFNQKWPQVLPGGRGVLYTAPDRPGTVTEANLVVQPLPNGAPKIVHRGGYHARYLPTGHLAYLHDGVLFALPFDLARLQTTGQAISVLSGVTSSTLTGSAQFAVSPNGTLVYLPGRSIGAARPVNWMDRAGKSSPLWANPTNWFNIRFSPDGRRLAMDVFFGSSSDVWVYDLDQDTATPLARHPAGELKPVWTPDGRRIAFNSDRDNASHNLYWQRADGTGDPQRLTTSTNSQWPVSWHPSGRFLAFEEHKPSASFDQNWDLMILSMEGDEDSGWRAGAVTAFLDGPSEEMQPNFSPDGRWLAYQSNETGRYEVYVRPLHGRGNGWRISTDGGTFPSWSRTKGELFYGINGQIMVAAYTVDGDTFRAHKPRPLPNVRYPAAGPARMFDLHPDGERFAVAPVEDAPPTDKVAVVLNFFNALQRIAGVTRPPE